MISPVIRFSAHTVIAPEVERLRPGGGMPVREAIAPHYDEIRTQLPDDMLLTFRTVRELTPTGHTVPVDDIIISRRGEEVTVRRHIPEGLPGFINVALQAAWEMARPDNALSALDKPLRELKQRLAEHPADPAVRLKAVKEAVTRESRLAGFQVAAEAEVDRPMFREFTDTVRLRQAGEELGEFMDRVESAANEEPET